MSSTLTDKTQTKVGVGLRHEHYFDALDHLADIDFVEVHAENFFSEGGAPKHLLQQARQHYDVSIHATSLGLGSTLPPTLSVMNKLKQLCDTLDPILVSDHACFNRALVHGKAFHTGDLLPLRFNQASLDILCQHVDMIQTTLQRTLLIENLSAYLPEQEKEFDEFDFLARLCKTTGCKLLLDINNLLVNAHNSKAMTIQSGKHLDSPTNNSETTVLNALCYLAPDMIGEYHLAGTTPAKEDEIMIDDHARSVSEPCWSLYEKVVAQFGNKPTLIEWDQDLPTWKELVSLAQRARTIQQRLSKD
jgi:uncharacterized protein (UPF0276 family)